MPNPKPKIDPQAIATRWLPLVKVTAHLLVRHLPTSVDVDDLIDAGVVGLMNAIAKYDEKMGVKFVTFARYRIRGEMLDALRNLDWASRDMRRRRKLMAAVEHKLEGKLHRPPTEIEMAAAFGVDLDRFRQMQFDVRGGLVYESGLPAGETLPDPSAAIAERPDDLCLRQRRHDAARTLSTGDGALLSRRDDHERSRRRDGRQRIPSIADT